MLPDLTIRLAGPSDAALFDSVAAEVFDGPIDANLLYEFLNDHRHHMVLAIKDGLIIGMATGVHYIHPDKPNELWVNEVGVTPDFQNQGIGRALMKHLLNYAKQIGCENAWLGTEPDNVAARALYCALGAREETMVYVTFDL